MNRRDFVVCSATAAAGLGVAGFALPATENAILRGGSGPLPYKVILDTRFRASCSFGARAARLGIAPRPIAGDVTALWFGELQPLWAKGDGALIGMTTSASLLCLEQLARDQWMRVVARVEHEPQPDGTLRHRLFLPGDTLTSARVALAQRGRWAEQLVRPLVASLASRHTSRPAESVALTPDALRADRKMTLVSWVTAARTSRDVAIRPVRCISTEEAPV